MFAIESVIIRFLLLFFPADTINVFLRDPQHTAIIIGCLIAVSGALLGTFLLLRGLALTSDAISHTVLLGIVVAFLLMSSLLGQEPSLSSPILLIGAAAAGVATVVLTEIIQRSGLVKQDAALGLAFPLLFAISIILVSRFTENVHLDQDAVMVGEIGVAWADTDSHCIDNCETVVIRPGDELARVTRQCTNCRTLGVSPRSDQAEFREVCSNCGVYSPAQARQAGLSDADPTLVFWPRSITVTGVMAFLTVLFVTIFYKELKLAAFDEALAKALGFRPGVMHYALMILVSLVAVGAFNAVGSVLVVAFFIIPPAAAYLLTDRLSVMLVLSGIIGSLGAFFGYDLARGRFLSIFSVDAGLAWLNRSFGLNLVEQWDSSISGSMVLMIFVFFLLAWLLSPRYGLVSTLIQRTNQRRRFSNQVVLGHIENHQNTHREEEELAVDTLHTHFRWSQQRMRAVMARLRALSLVNVKDGMATLTPRGAELLRTFREQNLAHRTDDVAGNVAPEQSSQPII